jgi:hypothetical protein
MEKSRKIWKISAIFLGATFLFMGLFAFFPAETQGDIVVPEDAHEETIYAGQYMEVGKVYVWHDEDLETLYVKYMITDEDWMISETHLAYGDELNDIPQTKKGNPIPGQFPYKTEHDPWVSHYLYEIDITGEFECEDMIYIAAHSVVHKDLGDERYQTETGWTGEHEFDGRNWAVYFKYTFECDDEEEPETPIIGVSSFGYEDLPFEGYQNTQNDFDYNDFVVDVEVNAGYDGDNIEWMEFTFVAEAKIAGFVHELNFAIDADVFAYDGTYDLYKYYLDSGDPYTQLKTPVEDATFDSDIAFDIEIFENTKWADLYSYITVLNITFDTSFPFDLSVYEYTDLDEHATGLFFDPYLVPTEPDTGEEIHIGDTRLLYVPDDWTWPTPDGYAIWDAYPYDGTDGVEEGGDGEPDYYGDWYTVPYVPSP